jgi:hypothetical protein
MYLNEWNRAYTGDKVAFEYHFWRNPCFDLSGIELAKRIYEDARAYERFGVNGFVQCGYPDMYFPTAFACYVYAKTIYNKNLSFDEIKEEYFSGIFGDGWREIYSVFEDISEILPFEYVSSTDALRRDNVYVDRKRAEALTKMSDVLKKEKSFIEAREKSERRVEALAAMILDKHVEFVSLMSEMFLKKAKGENEAAKDFFETIKTTFSRHKAFVGKYFSYYMYYMSLKYCAQIKPKDSTYAL